jgi:hypothetical protein
VARSVFVSFLLVIFRFGPTMELGRSGRPMMMPRRFGAPRATGSASHAGRKRRHSGNNFPKPGTTEPVPKESYMTRVGDQGCGVGYYK